ncbi:MAG: AAA family ATPase [Desulfovibrionales bacterium]
MHEAPEQIHSSTKGKMPGFVTSPFHNAPDPSVFFGSSQHRKGLEALDEALYGRRGLFLLMGEIGTGKTTLCRYLNTYYNDRFVIGHISNPFVTPREFEDQILSVFNIPGKNDSRTDFFRVLAEFLKAQHRQGKSVVLILDEAHLISLELFDHILILSNLQTAGAHLLQIVLSGQPELQNILGQPRFASLNQRISTRIYLTGLNRAETGEYIRFRMERYRPSRPSEFSPKAEKKIWEATGGIPRLINHLCARLLEDRFLANETGPIGEKAVRKAVRDPLFTPLLPPGTQATRYSGWRLGWVLAAAFIVSMFIVTGFALFSPGMGPGPGLSSRAEKAPTPQTPGPDSPGTLIPALPVAEPVGPTEAEQTHPSVPDPPLADTPRDVPEETDVPVKPEVSPLKPAPAPAPLAETFAEELFRDITINAIVWDNDPGKRMAVLNGDIVRQGNSINGIRVLKINKKSVELERDGKRASKGIEARSGTW